MHANTGTNIEGNFNFFQAISFKQFVRVRAERWTIDATERRAMDAIPLKKTVGNLGALTNKFIEFKQKESAVIAKTSKMSGHLFLVNHLLNLRERVIHVYLTTTPI
ncbi:hypothetical protein P8452_72112 [Trifolium repens]|nr:hypothetical protein P8452_72112 [Trifolium repens]